MNIYDHGVWTSYTPTEYPDGITPSIAAKIVWFRNDEGLDFYAYRNAGGFDAVSVKASCLLIEGKWVVMTASVDQSRLVPDDRRVIEIFDGDMDDPLAAYQHMIYDPATLTLSSAPPGVIVPDVASKLGLKRALSELGLWPQVKELIASEPDTQEEWDLALEIKRADPLTKGLLAAMNLSTAQVDAILIRARQLV